MKSSISNSIAMVLLIFSLIDFASLVSLQSKTKQSTLSSSSGFGFEKSMLYSSNGSTGNNGYNGNSFASPNPTPQKELDIDRTYLVNSVKSFGGNTSNTSNSSRYKDDILNKAFSEKMKTYEAVYNKGTDGYDIRSKASSITNPPPLLESFKNFNRGRQSFRPSNSQGANFNIPVVTKYDQPVLHHIPINTMVKKYIPIYYPVPVEHRINIPVKVPVKIPQKVLIPQAVPYGVKVPIPFPVKVEIPRYKEVKVEKPVYVKVPIYEHIPIYHHFAVEDRSDSSNDNSPSNSNSNSNINSNSNLNSNSIKESKVRNLRDIEKIYSKDSVNSERSKDLGLSLTEQEKIKVEKGEVKDDKSEERILFDRLTKDNTDAIERQLNSLFNKE